MYDDEPLDLEKYPLVMNKKMQVQDPLEEIGLGDGTSKWPTYTSVHLDPKLRIKISKLLQ